MWKKLKRCKSVKNKTKYKVAAKELKTKTLSEYEKSELNILNAKDLGCFYKHVNKNTVHKTGIGPLKTKTGILVLEDMKKAELLNEHFVSACTIDNGVLPNLSEPPTQISDFLENVNVSTTKIYKILKAVSKKTSCGPDGLPPILFNKLASQLAQPLSLFYSLLMKLGQVPAIWKKAFVTPVFKKGASSLPNNYRPISLTCVGSKIFESAIKSALVPFLENKKMLSADQHGFRSKHSTCLNLLECLNDWTDSLDTKDNTFVAHIDFSRAFDSVSLPKLVHKLQSAGISGNLLSCLKSMLFDRTQQVKIGDSLSLPKPVTSGVAQGSVLGPILFIFYINDLTEVVVPPSVSKLYADNLKIYCSAANDKEGKSFKNTLENITRWSEEWQLPISKEKSKWLLISNKNTDADFVTDNFELAGVVLPRVKEVLDLGVHFNARLNFSNHISITVAKAKRRLFLLKKSFKSKNPSLLIKGFKTYILPLLDYCCQVWNPQGYTEIRRIESVQRAFTKRLAGYNGLSYEARLEKAGLCTLEMRRLHADLCLCYNILHGNLDTEISKFFEIDLTGKNMGLRGHSWKIKTSGSRLDSRLHYFSKRIINPWNALSQKIVDSNSVATFKSLLHLESLNQFIITS